MNNINPIYLHEGWSDWLNAASGFFRGRFNNARNKFYNFLGNANERVEKYKGPSFSQLWDNYKSNLTGQLMNRFGEAQENGLGLGDSIKHALQPDAALNSVDPEILQHGIGGLWNRYQRNNRLQQLRAQREKERTDPEARAARDEHLRQRRIDLNLQYYGAKRNNDGSYTAFNPLTRQNETISGKSNSDTLGVIQGWANKHKENLNLRKNGTDEQKAALIAQSKENNRKKGIYLRRPSA